MRLSEEKERATTRVREREKRGWRWCRMKGAAEGGRASERVSEPGEGGARVGERKRKARAASPETEREIEEDQDG